MVDIEEVLDEEQTEESPGTEEQAIDANPDASGAEAESGASAEKDSGDDTGSDEDKKDPEEGNKKGRKNRHDKKLDALTARNEELEDRVKRQMAEFENFRKRTEKEKSVMFEMGAKSVIEKLLPVVDNFERGLASTPDDKKSDPVYEGMNLIYKQLMDELDKLGVKPIEALGVEFNPEFHNAVMQEDSEEFEEGFVCKELQKGYTYRDSVVRHSMVAVAK